MEIPNFLCSLINTIFNNYFCDDQNFKNDDSELTTIIGLIQDYEQDEMIWSSIDILNDTLIHSNANIIDSINGLSLDTNTSLNTGLADIIAPEYLIADKATDRTYLNSSSWSNAERNKWDTVSVNNNSSSKIYNDKSEVNNHGYGMLMDTEARVDIIRDVIGRSGFAIYNNAGYSDDEYAYCLSTENFPKKYLNAQSTENYHQSNIIDNNVIHWDSESIAQIREYSNREKSKTIKNTLKPNITISFGNVYETADVDKVIGRLNTIFKEEISLAPEGVYQK